ncbi:NfeD family protein [Parabacteroides sp. OttesenSCG-928-G07]|nr:NfeD family protein [Parabacteroides sp. OttesenSCG-928-G21]MDL2278111.1 NfeD family protein [Parabacteroides sp. OttesenSCG-928-G07]
MWFEITIIIFLIVLAIVLLLVEIFLLPGVTIAGIGGLLFAVGGLIYAYMVSVAVGNITLVSSVVAFGVVFFWLLRSKSFNKVALHTEIDAKLTSSRDLGIEPGDEGITLSRLAPIGQAKIKGINVEAKSQDELIDEGRTVEVIRVEGYNVIVKLKE